MAAAASQAARLGRNLSSEKLVSQPEQQQRQRHPTILRKSEFRDQLISQYCSMNTVKTVPVFLFKVSVASVYAPDACSCWQRKLFHDT
jgi:hypothetical protein